MKNTLGATSMQFLDIAIPRRAEMLDGTSWSKEFGWKEIEAFAIYTEAYRAPAGTVVFEESAREAYMCVIISGRVNVLKKDSGLENKVIAEMGPGKTFGEMSLIDGEPRSATVVVAQEATLLVLSKAEFARLSDEEPRLGVKFILKVSRLLCQHLRKTSGILADYLEV